MRGSVIEPHKNCRIIADCPNLGVHKSLFFNAIFVTIALMGCAHQSIETPVTYDFRVLGKIGVVDDGRGQSARIDWRQTGAQYAVVISGPLGQGRTELRGDERELEITRGSEVLASGPPEAVMHHHLGWSIPISVVSHWIMGEPDPEIVFSDPSRDDAERLTGFHQAGWQIAFDRFTGAASDALPRRVKAQSGTQTVTIAIHQR